MTTITEYRDIITDSEIADVNNNNEQTINSIAMKIGTLLNINVDRFERPVVSCLRSGKSEKRHVDYFQGVGLEQKCETGGPRTHTIVVHLNTTKDGGIWFPWLQTLITGVAGKITVIDYSDFDLRSRIESEHEVFKSTEDRWTITIWVRKIGLHEKWTGTSEYTNYYNHDLQETDLSIECGPPDDRRTLELKIEPNRKIGTGLVVGFTSGIDSSLLLYLLATINSYQTIPYIIQPVVIDNRLGCSDYPENRFWNPINESWTGVIKMIKFIQSEIPNGLIQSPIRYTANSKYKRRYQTSLGLHDWFKEQNQVGPNHYVGLYEAVLENIPELPNPPQIIYDSPPPWVLPFAKIQKQHVIDIIIELGLEKIFEITEKCPVEHETLTEPCSLQWQCMERRLGFVKLGKPELGERYLLNHDK
jgi:hypothetical protein